MSYTFPLDQDELVRQLLISCREDRQVHDSTAEAAKVLLRDYYLRKRAKTRLGRPRNLSARGRLADIDAIDRVYGAMGSDAGPQRSVRSAAKNLELNRRSVARWRAEPDFQNLVDQFEQEEWDWINSEDFDPD